MVVFTCNHCGETLQKPRVAKHYQFQCRNVPFLTCVDCFKDYRAEEYTTHTKCITENERYGGKNYIPKPGANKGEKKQQQWVNVVQNIIDSDIKLSGPEKNFLNSLCKYDNIPRKKAKFLNFVRSALGNRINMTIIDSVWSKMEGAYKGGTNENNTKENSSSTLASAEISLDNSSSKSPENHLVENQNNENISKQNHTNLKTDNEIGKSTKNNQPLDIESTNNKDEKKFKQKKAKKRKHPDSPNIDVLVIKRKNLNGENITDSVTENVETSNKTLENVAFNWEEVILNIMQKKKVLSLKKLQKKVISQYMNYYIDAVTYEEGFKKFNKKIKKVSKLTITDEIVKLT